MTCIVKNITTKKALKQACSGGLSVSLYDPSIVNPRHFTTLDMEIGEEVVCTNHPKRSWFASIKRTGENSWKVS